MEQEEQKAIGYFNRAEAFRLLLATQRNYPNSAHLPQMYRDSLRIYEKYGMDELIVKAGEQFFKSFPKSNELIDVATEVADAYARMNNHDKEWATYEYILPIAAARQSGSLLGNAESTY